MIYQHLPNNKHIHEEAVSKKLKQLRTASEGRFVCAYRENDLAFLFLTKAQVIFHRLSKLLSSYHGNSQHKYKSLHIRNLPVHSDAPKVGA